MVEKGVWMGEDRRGEGRDGREGSGGEKSLPSRDREGSCKTKWGGVEGDRSMRKGGEERGG